MVGKTIQHVKFIQCSFILSMTKKSNVFPIGYEYMRFVYTPFEMPHKPTSTCQKYKKFQPYTAQVTLTTNAKHFVSEAWSYKIKKVWFANFFIKLKGQWFIGVVHPLTYFLCVGGNKKFSLNLWWNYLLRSKKVKLIIGGWKFFRILCASPQFIRHSYKYL